MVSEINKPIKYDPDGVPYFEVILKYQTIIHTASIICEKINKMHGLSNTMWKSGLGLAVWKMLTEHQS